MINARVRSPRRDATSIAEPRARDRRPGGISLLYRADGEVDAIAAYCRRLESTLARIGTPTRMVTWRPGSIDTIPPGDVVVQYNPFAFGRWGFAPRLALDLVALRRRRPNARQAVMVHEPYVWINSPKSFVMGTWQRLQLRAVLDAADAVMVATSSWIPLLPDRTGAVTVPVGSNLPDRRAGRDDRRRALGADDGTLVLASFGTGHPSRLLDHVVAAANAVAARHRHVTLVCLGTATQPLEGLDPGVAVHRPGRQSEDELAHELSAADIFLSAFVDGLTTRRGSMMAALQHALPVVGTAGALTEPELRSEDEAIRWAPVGDRAAFATAALELAGDGAARARRGAAARALYERRFSWERIAESVVETLSAAPSRARAQ
jgi:glycosyltransferase involved in cell wall biosynthesis